MKNIGYGHIGFEILNKIVHHDKLKDVPKNFRGNTGISDKRASYKDLEK